MLFSWRRSGAAARAVAPMPAQEDLADAELAKVGLESAEARRLASEGLRAEATSRLEGRRGAQGAGEDVVYDRFSPRVCAALGLYVYRLVDPRNGETFYVGRGVNNRVFDHMEEAEAARYSGHGSAKTDRINAIHKAGLKVKTILHRHALRDDDETATLEAALIEAYPNLTNQVSGTGTRRFGARLTDAAIESYDLPPAPLDKERCLLLSLTARWPQAEADAPWAFGDIYAMARHGWSLEVERARKASYIVCHAEGVIRAVFVAAEWRASTDPIFAAFPKPATTPAYGFVGCPASMYVWENWVGRRVDDKYRTRFGQRVRYVRI